LQRKEDQVRERIKREINTYFGTREMKKVDGRRGFIFVTKKKHGIACLGLM